MIPQAYRGRYAYHFTHIDNLPGILKYGFLANTNPNFPSKGHKSIASVGIQKRRAEMAVPCGALGCVHDYVPLYFGSSSLMLLGVINAKNVDQMDILYFEFPIDLIEQPGAVFTDASANTAIPPKFFTNPDDLNQLNWATIDSKKWSEASDTLRHQRMAELLIPEKLAVTAASRCVVWNEGIKSRVEKIVEASGAAFPPVGFQEPPRYHWFTAFQDKKGTSVVTGPREIAMIYAATRAEVAKELGQHQKTAKFATLAALLDALRADFACTPQTAELVALKSANGVHKRTVDVHCQEVVAKLKGLPRFKALSPKDQSTVELAAYLHDIGKGPRARWDSNDGLQKVDPNHPVGAMPMMADILTRQVGNAPESEASILLKLVCYHDLIGDVIGRGRDEQQVVDVADSQMELDMLFALGEADASVLVEAWWDEDKAAALYKRSLGTMLK